MKCRQTSFFVDQDRLPEILNAVVDELTPKYRDIPHFLGVTLIKADHGNRAEVMTTSFWNDGLEGSDEASRQFVDEVHEISGSFPSRKTFDILFAQVRADDGSFHQA